MVALWPLLAAVGALCTTAVTAAANLTDRVTWDRFSLKVDGTRVFIQSAEFHYQRLPVPELWPDVFQKLKANGFNTLSIYFFWSYHSAAPGVFDFETPGKDVQRLFDAAKEAGLWVIARAGPYCNAETNGGSLALWGSDGSMGKLRTSNETYHQAWLPWISAIGKLIAKNQITNGGPVILNQIENELQETVYKADNTLVVYMKQIEAAFEEAGVVVPTTSNEKNMRSISWSSDYQNVGGAVNVYGLDSYPGSGLCSNAVTGFNVLRTYYQWFLKSSPTQPWLLAEFQGGWFSAWGSATFYDECTAMHEASFADVYYKNNIGQRATLQSIYMTFGGTNWGHSAAPVVYTSYDYTAPLRETRQQTTKLFQTKLVNLFSVTSPDLLKTEMVGNGTGFHVSSDFFTWVLSNPDTNATFTVLQQADAKSTANVSGAVTLDTSAGSLEVPDVALAGRQSKILATDYVLGQAAYSGSTNSNTLLFSSADVATSGTFGDEDVLVLYLTEGQTGVFAFRTNENVTFSVYGNSTVVSETTVGGHQAFSYVQGASATAVRFSNGVLVYLLDQATAWRFWAPQRGTVTAPQAGYVDRVFVLGPYLVRAASVTDDGVVQLTGDSDVATAIEVFAGTDAQSLEWNGRRVQVQRTAYGALQGTIPGGADYADALTLPPLDGNTTWYVADSLPEAQADYDDSRWMVCNKTTTLSPVAPETLPVLFSSDYGFYAGHKVYRGRFNSSGGVGGVPTAVNITASGGQAFGWTAWLNGAWLGGSGGVAGVSTTSAELAISAGLLAQNSSDNVLTVLVDYHGHDETSTGHGVENPRGLLGAALKYGANKTQGPDAGFASWRITGNAGGNRNIDPVRGPLNEGGLYGERLGWHLPGFDPAQDPAFRTGSGSTPADGLSGAGVRFYVTHFALGGSAPADGAQVEVPLGLLLGAANVSAEARVQLWINGYQYGKYVPHLGPQTRFPVPPGILNVGPGETNTLALSLWAQTPAGAQLSTVQLVDYGGRYETGFVQAFADDLQPQWTDRSEYA